MGMTLEEALAAGGKPHGMTAEEAMAAGGRAHREPKYPQPRSMTEDDQAVGLETGPIESARLPGTALSMPLRPDMSQVEFDQLADQHGENVRRIENALAGGAAGAGLGLATRSAAAPVEGGRLAAAADVLRNGVKNSFLHGGTAGIAVNALKALLPGIGATAANTLSSAAVAGAGGVGAAGGSMVPAQNETPEMRLARILLGQSPPFPQGE